MELLDLMNLLVEDTEKMNIYINRDRYDNVNRPAVDTAFQDFNRMVCQRKWNYKSPRFVDRVFPQMDYNHDDTLILPFNGGKVCLALAIRYKDMGKKVHLFYVENSGVSRFGEDKNRDSVEKLAKMLGMPLTVDITSYHYFEESLMKNLLIIGRALRFAVANGHSPEILYGTFETAYLANNNFSKDGKNCTEIISSYIKVVQKFCFSAKVTRPLPSYASVWDELITHTRYIPYVKCHGAIENRIWYIALVDHNLIPEEDKSKYMKYIKDLLKSLESQAGHIEVLWNKYFFYRIEKSKHYQELMKLPT